MAKFNEKCGRNAIDEFDDYTRYSDGTHYRSHNVRGKGAMTNCHTRKGKGYEDQYTIHDGITELADNCLSAQSVKTIYLPKSLKKIGSSCFNESKISSLSLPDNLEEMGHTNFPESLYSISLPAKLKIFPNDNFRDCINLREISVHEDNKHFKIIDGILYNYDVTEILICPRGKSGKFIIPKTVKRIADYCFDGCSELTSIELPSTIETIGCYAFSEMTLDRLVIPNSVIEIGESCFWRTTIRKKIRFSQRITSLPNYCFNEANIPSTDFLKNIEEIGDSCFEDINTAVLPTDLKLPKVKKIGKSAFKGVSDVETIELSSCIQQIGEGAFSSTSDILKILFLSMVPLNTDEHAFSGLSDNATLYVPIGSKVIFENSMPWSTISQIEEIEPEKDISDDDKSISDEHLYFRLQNIASSFANADRYYLQEILQNVVMNYQNVDNEDDYNEAIQIIQYNRRFSPPLIHNLENDFFTSDWRNKYKLKLANYCIMNSKSSLLSIPAQETNQEINELTKKEIPQLIEDVKLIGDISSLTQEVAEDVEVYFSDILRHLQNELSMTTKNIKIAVSWFRNYALFKQIKQIAQQGISVQLIINNDLINNGGRCLNFNELIEVGVHISLVEFPHLIHHKFCIIDDKIVINGSYNWTNLSQSNYENMMIFRNNDEICDAFNEEFERVLSMAEHKDIQSMPDSVPLRPEYDRSAYKQYITEDLNAEALLTSNQHDKIAALQKAHKLNPKYLEKINPEVKDKFKEEFEVIEQSETIAKTVVAMVKESNQPSKKTTKSQQSKQTAKTTSTKAKSSVAPVAPIKNNSIQESTIIQQVRASNMFMVLDVSGSMEKTYIDGHVANITKKSVSAALALSESKKVSLWEFGDDAVFIEDIDVANISSINNVHCKNQGTYLKEFVSNADSSIKKNSLVIIFTDDDGESIRDAVPGMKKRTEVFWQVIVYGKHKEIDDAIKDVPNISLVSMTNYASKTDEEITKALLKDYIQWKNA